MNFENNRLGVVPYYLSVKKRIIRERAEVGLSGSIFVELEYVPIQVLQDVENLSHYKRPFSKSVKNAACYN